MAVVLKICCCISCTSFVLSFEVRWLIAWRMRYCIRTIVQSDYSTMSLTFALRSSYRLRICLRLLIWGRLSQYHSVALMADPTCAYVGLFWDTLSTECRLLVILSFIHTSNNILNEHVSCIIYPCCPLLCYSFEFPWRDAHRADVSSKITFKPTNNERHDRCICFDEGKRKMRETCGERDGQNG